MGLLDKKCVQLTGLGEWYRDFFNKLSPEQQAKLMGVGMGILTEPLAPFEQAACEKVLGADGSTGWHGAYIVLGRDRPASTAPHDRGYGPKGCTGAASIDLVVGRNAAKDPFGAVDSETPDGGEKKVNPNFKTDAARIYISQRADIDDYFGTVAATGGRSTGKSAVGIKADAVRLIAREGIKIISGFNDPFNSQGTAHGDGKDGIYLIYGNTIDGNNNDLQPLVKGNNLVECLKAICDTVGNTVDWCSAINTRLSTLVGMYAAHQHLTTGPGAPVSPVDAPLAAAFVIPETVADIIKQGVAHSQNDATHRVNYYEHFGGKHILSKWNQTN